MEYGSKIFTEPDVNKKSNEKNKAKIHVAALNNIFQAMKGHRIFDRFGFNLLEPNKRQIKFAVLSWWKLWNGISVEV